MVRDKEKIKEEIESLRKNLHSNITPAERMMLNSKINALVKELEQTKEDSLQGTGHKIRRGEKPDAKKEILDEISTTEEITVKRLGKSERKENAKKTTKPNAYIKFSNNLFSKIAIKLFNENKLNSLEKDLIKSNMNITPTSYLSGVLTATVASIIFSIIAVITLTFLLEGSLIINLTKVFWMVFVIPFVTFVGGYVYPSLEKGSVKSQINQELPFATIHMSAISGSMIEPSNIFEIIISTKEYKTLEKEFTKIMNGINI